VELGRKGESSKVELNAVRADRDIPNGQIGQFFSNIQLRRPS
jgi:hypothetical protein